MGPNPLLHQDEVITVNICNYYYIYLQTALHMSTFLSFIGLLCLAQVTLKALPPFDSVLFG